MCAHRGHMHVILAIYFSHIIVELKMLLYTKTSQVSVTYGAKAYTAVRIAIRKFLPKMPFCCRRSFGTSNDIMRWLLREKIACPGMLL